MVRRRCQRKWVESRDEREGRGDLGDGVEVVMKAGQARVVVHPPGAAPLRARRRILRTACFQENSGVAWSVGDQVVDGIGVLMRSERDCPEEEKQIESTEPAQPESGQAMEQEHGTFPQLSQA